jgi:hypothetical protein
MIRLPLAIIVFLCSLPALAHSEVVLFYTAETHGQAQPCPT